MGWEVQEDPGRLLVLREQIQVQSLEPSERVILKGVPTISCDLNNFFQKVQGEPSPRGMFLTLEEFVIRLGTKPTHYEKESSLLY